MIQRRFEEADVAWVLARRDDEGTEGDAVRSFLMGLFECPSARTTRSLPSVTLGGTGPVWRPNGVPV